MLLADAELPRYAENTAGAYSAVDTQNPNDVAFGTNPVDGHAVAFMHCPPDVGKQCTLAATDHEAPAGTPATVTLEAPDSAVVAPVVPDANVYVTSVVCGTVPVAEGDGVADAVLLAVALSEVEPVALIDGVPVGLPVGVGGAVADADGVSDADAVTDADAPDESVGVDVGGGVSVAVGVAEGVGGADALDDAVVDAVGVDENVGAGDGIPGIAVRVMSEM